MASSQPPDTVNLVDMVNAIFKAVMVDAGLLGQLISGQFIVPLFKDAVNWAAGIAHLNLGKDLPTLQTVQGLLGRPFVDNYFSFGLNVDPNPKEKEYAQAIDLIRQLVSFSLIFPYVMQGVARVGQIALAGRWSHKADEFLGKIPEEMGIAWALGGILQSIFDQVAGQKIEEYINVTKHPARPDQSLILRLLRQHKVSHDQYNNLMNLIGFNDYYKQLFEGVDQQQMPITDVQALFLDGVFDEKKAKAYLTHLGFSSYPQTVTVYESPTDTRGTQVSFPSDVDLLYYLYFNKAETAAGSTYRNYAKQAFLEDRITDTEFVSILRRVNVPENSIQLELEALKFEKLHGHANLAMSAIKKRYIAGTDSIDVATRHLEDAGYTYDDARKLIQSWDIATATRKPGLTAAKILAYLNGGILSHSEAVSKLQGLGYTLTDAVFLSDHPETKSNSGGIPLTEGNIAYAFNDGTLSASQAHSLLLNMGKKAEDATLLLNIWQWQKENSKAAASGAKALPPSEIYAALSRGGISDGEAIDLLEQDGYAVSDAEIIWRNWYEQIHGGSAPTRAPIPS